MRAITDIASEGQHRPAGGTVRSLTGASAILLLLASGTGCFGVGVVFPDRDLGPNPAPRVDSGTRWACQISGDEGNSPVADHQDFIDAWGEPTEIIPEPAGETWIYRESYRWCGLVVWVHIPIPLMLPVCSTSDRVSFDTDGLALSSRSWRLDIWGAGVFAIPGAAGYIRPGKLNEGEMAVVRGIPDNFGHRTKPMPC